LMRHQPLRDSAPGLGGGLRELKRERALFQLFYPMKIKI
jgi:hypothetical protein